MTESSVSQESRRSARKGLGRVQMEDVLALAPKGDRSVYKYENDNSLACKDLTSGESGTKIYELVFKGEKGINREFEPDEEMPRRSHGEVSACGHKVENKKGGPDR